MTEAERLVELLMAFSRKGHTPNERPWRELVDNSAALIRAQSARIAALEDALREIMEYADMVPREQYCYQIASDALDGRYVPEALYWRPSPESFRPIPTETVTYKWGSDGESE